MVIMMVISANTYSRSKQAYICMLICMLLEFFFFHFFEESFRCMIAMQTEVGKAWPEVEFEAPPPGEHDMQSASQLTLEGSKGRLLRRQENLPLCCPPGRKGRHLGPLARWSVGWGMEWMGSAASKMQLSPGRLAFRGIVSHAPHSTQRLECALNTHALLYRHPPAHTAPPPSLRQALSTPNSGRCSI